MGSKVLQQFPHIVPRASAAVWLCGILLASVAGLTWQQTPLDTKIQGRTLDEWRELINQINLQDPSSRHAVPGLLELVRRDDVPWFTRRQAALTLGRLGPHADGAVPALIELLTDNQGEPETSPRLWAIKALALYGPLARAAAPHLAAILNDSSADQITRLSAVEALWRIGVSHPDVIPVLLQRAQQPAHTEAERELQLAAVEALGAIGPAASVAVPLLVRFTEHPDEQVRGAAVTALGQMPAAAELFVEALLMRLISEESAVVRDAATVSLQRLPPAVVAESLAPLLSAENPEWRQRAATILGMWGKGARAWAALLEPLWEDPHPAVRNAALEASWRITQAPQELLPHLVSLLTAEDRQTRRNAVLLLEEMGARAATVQTQLERLLEHERPEVRVAAKKALQAITTGNPLPSR